MITGWTRWVIRHRLAVIVVASAVTVVMALGALNLRVEVDADRQLPQDHPYIVALNRIYQVFGDKNLVVVGLFPHDGNVFTPAFLGTLARVTKALERVPGANPSLVQSLASPSVKVIRGTADGLEVERVLDEIPTTAAGVAAVRARAFESGLFVDTLVSRDGSAASVQASFELTPLTPDYRSLTRAVNAAIAGASDGTFDYSLAGPVVFLARMTEYSSRMAILFPIALLVIALVHYDAFRTLQGLFLPVLTAVMSVLWAVGLMGLLGVPLDPLNTTTPILILAVAAGHAVQVLKRFYEELATAPDQHAAIVTCMAKIGPVMLGAGTVAMLSFFSLLAFETASIRTFGLFTGLGIFSALVIELSVIPAVRAVLPAPRGQERARERARHRVLDGVIESVSRLVARRRGAVGLVVVGLLAAMAMLARRVEVDTSLKSEFRATDRVRRDDARINQRFAGTNTMILLVEGKKDGALEDPAVLRGIRGFEQAVAKEPSVGKVLSYVDFLETMHRAMNADRPEAGPLPATRELAAQYLFLYSIAGGDEDFDSILDPAHRIAKVRMLVHDDSTEMGERLIARVKQLVHQYIPPGYDVQYTGTIASTAASTETMVRGKLANIAQIACITVLVSGLLLGSAIGGVLVVIPLGLAVAVNFGVMGLLRVPLDNMTAAISAMAVGIGADYAMYLLFRIRQEAATSPSLDVAVERALATAGKAVLFVSTAVSAGYATLMLSGFKVHVQLGGLVALAMVVSSLAALVVLPTLVLAIRPAFLVDRVPAPAAAEAA
jgi:predicted RND superfamily exporter protein